MKFLIFICLLFAVMQTTQAQFAGMPYIGYVQKPAPPSSTMGNDFWVSFENVASTPVGSVYLALNIASQLATTVTISFTNNSHSYTYNLVANISRRIDISQMVSDGNTGTTDERAGVYLSPTAGTSNLTMHITSTQPIAVYAFDTYAAATDATVIYPIAVWGTDYYQVSYNSVGGISNEIIIANQDNTVITLSDNTSQTLNRGQVCVTSGGTADITGRHFSSSVPVSYFAGVTITNIPSYFAAGDAIFEQMVPTKVWDTAYFVPNAPQFASSASDSINNRIRIVSAKNGTRVTYTGATRPGVTPAGSANIASGATLDSGKWTELVISSKTGGAFIHANNPIGVAGYLVGQSSGIAISDSLLNGVPTVTYGNGGDPDHAMIPGLNQLIQQVTISPFMFPLYTTATSPPTGYSNTDLPYTNFDGNTSDPTFGTFPDVIHGAIILTKTANKGSINMVRNGTTTITLTNANWVDDAASGMSIYRYRFDNVAGQGASYTISSFVNGGGLLVLCYGLAWYESYYYNAGSGAYSLQ